MRLNARFVQTVSKPGLYYDDKNGLALIVRGPRSKSWVQRFTIKGNRRVDRGLGSLRFVSLADARSVAHENALMGSKGIDPSQKTCRQSITFSAATKAAHIERAGTYKNPKDHDAFYNSLRTHVFPALGDKPLSEISSSDIRGVVLSARQNVASLSRKILQRINVVMKWGIAEGYLDKNPANAEALALPVFKYKETKRLSLPYQDVPTFLRQLEARKSSEVCKDVIAFIILTAARSKEAREAVWEEFDLEASQPTWTVPAERMKMNLDHRVPLSAEAVGLLTSQASFGYSTGMVFPGAKPGRPISDMGILKEAKSITNRTTIHGFRSSFRTWAQEQTNISGDVAEAALSHNNLSTVEAAYARSDLFDKRADLMQQWARYLINEQ